MLTSQNIHWLAGFLDGEGYFGRKKSGLAITCTQKDKWMVERIKELVGGSIYLAPDPKTKAEYWRWQCSGSIAAGVMMTVYSLMSPRRQARIAATLEHWKALPRRGEYNRAKTHCKRGHEFTPENTYAKDGKYRQCRICQKSAAHAWYEQSKNELVLT